MKVTVEIPKGKRCIDAGGACQFLEGHSAMLWYCAYLREYSNSRDKHSDCPALKGEKK